jgi:hypothetical protein
MAGENTLSGGNGSIRRFKPSTGKIGRLNHTDDQGLPHWRNQHADDSEGPGAAALARTADTTRLRHADPLIWEHVNPYGRFDPDMNARLALL